MNGLEYKKGGGSIKRLGLLLLLPFIILVLSFGVYKLFFIAPPVIEGIDSFNLLPAEKTITLNAKNLESIQIFVRQGLKSIELLNETPQESEWKHQVKIRPKELGLKDGTAKVVVKASSGILKKVEYEIESQIDSVPPTLSVLKSPYRVEQGASGFALLRAEGADSVFIKLGGYTFKAYEAEAGVEDEMTSKYVSFFPVPYGVEANTVFYAIARDAVGNQVVRALSTRLRSKDYKADTIPVSDSFIERVVYALLGTLDKPDPVMAFRKANEEWRARNAKKIWEIGQDSEPARLWSGHFLRNKGKLTAGYGEKRTYTYEGELISESVHLGYDLASLKTYPIKAANSGVVKYARDLGIYGNTVIIDHGLGVMSLYAHLSIITVNEGDMVTKGELIANSGDTGLAGGDHLHFGMLVQGYEVTPRHWWDRHWVKVNIEDLLN